MLSLSTVLGWANVGHRSGSPVGSNPGSNGWNRRSSLRDDMGTRGQASAIETFRFDDWGQRPRERELAFAASGVTHQSGSQKQTLPDPIRPGQPEPVFIQTAYGDAPTRIAQRRLVGIQRAVLGIIILLLTAGAIIIDQFHHFTHREWVQVGTTLALVYFSGLFSGLLLGQVRFDAAEHTLVTPVPDTLRE